MMHDEWGVQAAERRELIRIKERMKKRIQRNRQRLQITPPPLHAEYTSTRTVFTKADGTRFYEVVRDGQTINLPYVSILG